MPGGDASPADREKSPRTGWFLALVHDEQVVPRYAVRLQVHADRPLTQQQLEALDGDVALHVGGFGHAPACPAGQASRPTLR